MTVSIAKHGFPASIGSIDVIIDIARIIGQALLLQQAAIHDVYAGKQNPTDKIWVRTKPDGSSVTSSDIWANALIEEKLCALSFDADAIGILSEESDKGANKESAKKPAAFVVDPLDNTGDYKKGRDNWSVTIGFETNGIPTGGVVYYPARRRLFFTGDDGKSYFLNEADQNLTELTGPGAKRHDDLVSGAETLRIITDFNIAARTLAKAATITALHAGHTDRYWAVTIAGPDGADIAEHGDLFYAWDIVAPAAIASRAGVVYLNRDGTPLDFLHSEPGHNDFEMPRDGFIAGNAATLKNMGFLKPPEASR